MPTAEQIQDAIATVHNQESFIKNLLIDALGWKIPEGTPSVEEISYPWTATELNAEGLDKKIVDGQIWQIQPLEENRSQPWGIFVLEFTSKEVFTTGRGLTGPLRKILRGLVPKRRGGRSNLPSWNRENLLFICTNRSYQHFRFAYFKAPAQKEKTAPLAMFGWNQGDTDIRTLCTHNLPYLQWDYDRRDDDKWRQAFSIEKVTKDFYREYAAAFAKVEAIIEQSNSLDKNDLRLFTQTLFNRLMFLRFIEKKGWLTFQNQTGYLSALYRAGGIDNKSFYISRLCPLFFEALAIEGKQESDAIGKVPFLNGGLFEITELDKKIADIDDVAFVSILGPDGLFYHYNFTIEESTPLDIEVAVDPEMLGKVFEELVTGRHESGSYYTPRPIVAFMCREAIKAYLIEKTSAPANAVETLVDEHQIADGLTEQHADEILFYLETIKAIDPACGSGAYLLGLLQELIDIRRTLQNQQLRSDPDFLYKLKLRLISQCLYGVDIDEFATNIAKLRLWLSLSVESAKPQPLPNLDFKIETGDSILGPCDPLADRDDALMMSALRDRAQNLVVKKDRYMTAHGQEKLNLYDEIKAEEAAIAQETSMAVGKGIIVWYIHFAEVFTRSRKCESIIKGEFGFMGGGLNAQKTLKIIQYEPGGFDIVLANPPYIRQELIKDIKPRLKDIFKDTFTGTADLYTYFYTRAVELLAPGGVLSFISPNKWFRATYGKKLRAYIANKCRVLSITDFQDSPIFESATAYPMIFIAQKTTKDIRTILTETRVPTAEGLNVLDVVQRCGRRLSPSAIQGRDWSFADDRATEIVQKMKASGVPLKEYVNGQIYYGIKTGFNEAFVIDGVTRQRLIDEDSASEEIIKPLLMGKNIKRWTIDPDNKWIIVTPIGVEIHRYPAIYKHLSQWQTQLEARHDQGNNWWELRACAYYDKLEMPKILFPEVALEARFTFDKNSFYPLKTVFSIPLSDLYLLGILNSRLAYQFLKGICITVRGGYLTWQATYIEQLPIPHASEGDKQAIAELVQQCLDAQGQNCQGWEAEINARVARLYGLTDEKNTIVENSGS